MDQSRRSSADCKSWSTFSCSPIACLAPFLRNSQTPGRLVDLNLSENRLTSIPLDLTSLAKLQNLLVSDNLLSGPFPSQVTGLTELVRLRLANNDLNGEVPDALRQMRFLREVSLSGNACLTGETAALTMLLDSLDAAWSDGCP